MEVFIEALNKNKETQMKKELYKDNIELYSKKKIFSFLIPLFLKLYEEEKDLCKELLNTFKKMNEDPNIKKIADNADTLIEKNKYDIIEFYGIILCYLNSYDYDNFSSIIKELFNNKTEELFEIMLIYNTHFRNPINQNSFFFYKFINYAIEKKDFQAFENGLNFIKDIETYITVIEKNKEEFFKKYNSKKIKEIIRLDNLKFKKGDEKEISTKPEENNINTGEDEIIISNGNKTSEEKKFFKNESETKCCKIKKNKNIFELLKSIKSIIDFSNDNKTFLIYFTNNFWEYVLNYFNEPEQDNILICSNLRELFISYYNLVKTAIPEKDKDFSIIRKDYFERDEFAFLLDQIIRKYIDNNNKELENIEKLIFIVKYNPYYKDPKYSNKIDCDLFDKDFIEDFKNILAI